MGHPKLREDVKAVHLGKKQIEQNQIDVGLASRLQAGLPVRRIDRLETSGAQRVNNAAPNRIFILDNYDDSFLAHESIPERTDRPRSTAKFSRHRRRRTSHYTSTAPS